MILNDPRQIAIDTTGSITGNKYTGLFKIKPLLSFRDKLRLDESRRQLLGAGEGVKGVAEDLSVIFSKIWAHLLEAPSWWKDSGNGIELLDEEPVIEVFEGIRKIEAEIAEQIAAEAKKSTDSLKK